ncbi:MULTISPECIES: PilZ domain-containing protein [Thalassobaculum]|uniref:PilZ domain-containing protein n=1 Tax=Thalassobaculum litoreum DSM 18839 TaxID=1123362 RepID=A0A8G2EWW4_9PROT|nr:MULTISPECIES: PilZ domain-containing protein [Thalassobaculum]SDG46051.1 PilZ domain-containing protein [Thalassobaculum litoreum DSM 18839]
MSLSDPDAISGEGFFKDIAIGRDQRMQDRYVTHRTAINVDRQRCLVFDISTGGLRMQMPPETRKVGDDIRGLLVCKAGGADIRVIVHGRIVRVEPDGQSVGVQFADLPPAHLEAVKAIIHMMERLEIEASYEQARRPKSSPPMLRAAVAIAVFGATIGIGALYLTIR